MYCTYKVLVLYLTFATLIMATEHSFNMFNESMDIHKQVCSLSPLCGPGFWQPVNEEFDFFDWKLHRCCGSCSCNAECYLHGSCCLHKYDGFEQGHRYVEDSRYSWYTVDSRYLEFQGTLKHFEMSVPRYIRVAEVRKTINRTTTFNK